MMVFINIPDQRNAEYIKPYAFLQFDPDQLQAIANTTSPGAFSSMTSSFAEHGTMFLYVVRRKNDFKLLHGGKNIFHNPVSADMFPGHPHLTEP